MDSKKIKEWIRKLTAGGGARTWLRKDRLLILLLSGVLLLVITLPVSDRDGEEDSALAQEGQTAAGLSGDEDYAGYMERKLEEVLSEVSGVGEVKVMVTLRSTSEKVVEKDEEQERGPRGFRRRRTDGSAPDSPVRRGDSPGGGNLSGRGGPGAHQGRQYLHGVHRHWLRRKRAE